MSKSFYLKWLESNIHPDWTEEDWQRFHIDAYKKIARGENPFYILSDIEREHMLKIIEKLEGETNDVTG